MSGIVLLSAGILVWWGEYRRELTVGIGVGVGVAGLVVLMDVWTDTGFSGLRLAGFIVALGVVDYVARDATKRERSSPRLRGVVYGFFGIVGLLVYMAQKTRADADSI